MNQIPLSELPTGVLVSVAVLIVLQLGLQVFAVVKLFRTPEERVVWGKRWPWLLIIVFGEILGAVVFLAAGRKPAEASDPLTQTAAPNGERAARAADVLYGPKDGEQ